MMQGFIGNSASVILTHISIILVSVWSKFEELIKTMFNCICPVMSESKMAHQIFLFAIAIAESYVY